MFGSTGFLLALLAWAPLVRGSPKYFQQRNTIVAYAPKQGPLDTAWTEKVGTNPWPQYPRPQLQRSKWQTLNGLWEYTNGTSRGDADVDIAPNITGTHSVLVPYCLESALSGFMGNWTVNSWYKRTFTVPNTWTGDRVLLNFEAVDYEATVFVNTRKVGFHRGGYFSFSFDVTDYLSTNGTNELLVFAYDPTDSAGEQIPIGKQSLWPSHIFYTPCSGIWQTVWLEAAPSNHISKLDLSADMNGQVNVTVNNSGNSSSPVEITIYEPGSTDVKHQAKGSSGAPFQFTVDKPDLWSPDSPTLYNITVKMDNDTIQSYTGFRTIGRARVNNIERPLLNGKPIFTFGTLDQGFWPDGLYTPPTKEAMVYDLQILKRVGFNMVRKHIKVEPALFYQACDIMGLLVIQDMPSLKTYIRDPEDKSACPRNIRVRDPSVQEEFNRQLALMIQQLKNYPSIFTWVIYNEGWGQEVDRAHPEFQLTDLVKSIDPTRLVNSVSGWDDHGAGDFHDNHHYANPQCGTPFYSLASTPWDPSRIAIQGEFGGVGHNVSADHLWKVQNAINSINGTYELDADLPTWNYRALKFIDDLREQTEFYACAGGVYTQTTDVEGEVNGLITYDRRLNRMNEHDWKEAIKALYEAAAKRF